MSASDLIWAVPALLGVGFAFSLYSLSKRPVFQTKGEHKQL
ncbi:hypothetical protein JOC77_000829 [Peribacillus deserti]|uniref:Uncharacterized protein n=1 Tax=Peribacillus deserti TaxID=673318 RepID=A0ABS2QF24_9BACI|nr:hypothetical protein [Peribacillus deserti]MBM7691424.1 hypothetical protein [Peribacillus deserti]